MNIPMIDARLLGFDFDGVVADTAEAFIRLACEEYGYCGFTLEDITNFQVEECLDMPQERVEAIFTRILKDSIGIDLRPMPGVVEVLGQLCEKAPVTVITARPEKLPVTEWLNKVFPASTAECIHVVAMGNHDQKFDHINRLGLRYFIDDRAETCLRLHEQGIQPFVFHQPWNKGRHHLPQVRNWQDVRALCIDGGTEP